MCSNPSNLKFLVCLQLGQLEFSPLFSFLLLEASRVGVLSPFPILLLEASLRAVLSPFPVPFLQLDDWLSCLLIVLLPPFLSGRRYNGKSIHSGSCLTNSEGDILATIIN